MTLRATIEALYIGRVETRWPERPPSAIGKTTTADRLELTTTGFRRDSQADLTVHGGPDKAVHHYASDHYADWRNELGRDDLRPGGFGENISTFGLTEDRLCIGDIFTLGTATVQISQGRQPCWKLSAHTGEERMAFLFQKSVRTGWYYRVLEPGHIQAGDEITLQERPCPEWSLKAVTEARLTRRIDRDAAEHLSQLPELADGWREAFDRIAKKAPAEDTRARLEGK
ncbi:MOSC domain-containing protein [Amorphus sp. 3PC139-8]|uniref:MOSC domain-containing protein n=1 Tax=Amorphus sp. 3PC139-8 TaxID=2735676 RepID=UPI00345DE03B